MGKMPKIIMLFIAFMLVSTNLWAVNTLQTIPYEGMVYDAAGTPLSGLQNFTFSLIQSPSSNTDLWSENFINQPVDNGKFSVLLGSNTAIPPELILYPSLYLVMTVNGDRSSTPLPITGYMYSLFANYAQTANAVLYVDGKVIKPQSVSNEKIISVDAAKVIGVLNNVASTANVAITALTANVALYLDGVSIKDASISDGKIITLDAAKVIGILNNVASTANHALTANMALTSNVALSALTANIAITADFANNVPSYFVSNNYGYNVSVNGVISANSFIGNDLFLNKATIRGPITHLTYTLSIAGGGDYNLNSHGESVIFLTASKNIMLPTATDSTIGNVYKIYYTKAVTADINAQSGQTINNNGYYSFPKTTSEWAYVEIIGYTNTSWIAISGGPYAP